MEPDTIRPLMVLKIKTSVSAEGLFGETTGSILITSSLQWIQAVEGMLVEPTKNRLLLSNAISQTNAALGASQLFDGVDLAAKRLIDFQFSNTTLSNYDKMIVVLSDGDENNSENSLNQALDSVSAISGENNTPILSVKLGQGYAADEIVMLKMAEDTNGSVRYCRNQSPTEIIEIVDELITSEEFSFNNGSYVVTLNSEELVLPNSASIFGSVILPTNSHILYRIRTSSDGINWTSWTDWRSDSLGYNFEENLDNLAGYYQYEVKLFSNELFESPKITKGLDMEYFKPKSSVVFFNPLALDLSALEYMSSILITQEGVIPETSTVTYGVTQSLSVDPNDYFLNGIEITPDRHEILFSRYNEPMFTTDYKNYFAINGSWANGSAISIYKYNDQDINGILVPALSYSINSINGSIGFSTIQDYSDKFMICIDMSSLFRFICKIKNYGSKTATIDHIGLIYNIMKRIPTSRNGTIIHKTLDKRI